MMNLLFYYVLKKFYVGALNQFSKNIALEWAKDNIRANVVAPGPVMTILLENAMV
jgi:Tropinone reductase 1